MAIIPFFLQQLWGHITWSSNLCYIESAAIFALERTDEAKINQLDTEVIVKQDILGLEVSVSETHIVDVIDTHQDLLEVKAAQGWPQATLLSDV